MPDLKVHSDDLIAWALGIFAAAAVATLLVMFVIVPYNNLPSPGPRSPIGVEQGTDPSRSVTRGPVEGTVPSSGSPTRTVTVNGSQTPQGTSQTQGQTQRQGSGLGGSTGGSGPVATVPRPIPILPLPPIRTPIVRVVVPPLIPGVTIPPISVGGVVGLS
jgi:hypothetical protein